MNRLRIHRKQPVYLGIILIVAGIFLKRFIELTLVPDMQIESPAYIALIYVVQLLAIASGIVLLVKQPAIRTSEKN